MLNLSTSYSKYKKRPLSRSFTRSSTENSQNETKRETLAEARHLDRNVNTESNNNKSSMEKGSSTSTRSKKYSVLFRKYSQKKNKIWEGDGSLILNCNLDTAVIYDDDGNQLAKVKSAEKTIFKGIFSSCGYEFEVDCEESVSKVPKISLNSGINHMKVAHKPILTKFVSPLKHTQPLPSESSESRKLIQLPITPSLQNLKQNVIKDPSQPLYDISKTINPLFMPDLPRSIDNSELQKKVVVDPSLSVKLRPHQREGITFMYSCLMGLKASNIRGVILADEMGLGKTLQTITLIWTLLRQSPIANTKPVIDKVLICCPVSLVSNWKKEFEKWLGINRLGVLVIYNNKYSDEKQDIELFGRNKVYQVLIIGYEKMQSMSESLSKIKFDLLVCDEGHRLKNNENKTMKTLESFKIRKRIILTGTPIQNDLQEFYTIANFTNNGILGDLKSFQKDYIKPILESRDSNCNNTMLIKKGKEKSAKLLALTNLFILRRSNEEMSKYLPKRSDYILLVPPTPLQLQLFQSIISTRKFKMFLSDEGENSTSISAFNLINTFRKICNSPSLLKDDGFFLELCERNTDSPEDKDFRNQLGKKIKSGKILLLIKILGLLHSEGKEKVIIVSNFTSTLDIIESLFKSLNLKFSRLDGATPSNERGKLVENFNKTTPEQCFAMLLSAKAGGVGLNLIGASRLILFDNDWNPAVDLQAIARIHRDGQAKEVKVYRLLTNGCIDEKIFQRQLIKQDLSDRFLDKKGGEKELFDRSEVKDIFSVQFERMSDQTYSNTHEMMCCDCNGGGDLLIQETSDQEEVSTDSHDTDSEQNKRPTFMTALSFSQNYTEDTEKVKIDLSKKKKLRRCLSGYRHINPSRTSTVKVDDDILNQLLASQNKVRPLVSFVFGKYT
ncbi:hypothetical protein CANINC_003479 [Pichia inconspicua]|uniref:DNA repair and recombination protein RDH54 n=1 Tax=Pichia inconspicua TaxID=52247 RepID=A0A4T0WYP2_9ASCO|nr:hypothetical protein CANINC_003479 [[Candida] inconspicua]